ncbi:MAG: heparinase II/III family protein [Sedimentisphaerales bacterium]|nr:heparinase II/III family protein [Sedimentisphaerales bacterium]
MIRILFLLFSFVASFSMAADYPSDPGSRGVDWTLVKQKVNDYTWARSIVNDLRKEVQRTQNQFQHPPFGKTGWWHNYYCSEDAHRLDFHPEKPHEHICPSCKKVYSGPPYDDCWNSIVHVYMVRASEYAAILYRLTGESQYLDYTRNLLLWYADHYDEFEVHGEHAGKGRIRSQSLDEATQLVSMVRAYWEICPMLTPQQRTHILEDYFLPDAEFILSQTRAIHNIHSWHNAAVGLVGFVSDRNDLIEKAIDGPYGLKQQIAKGIQEDGFWYEGSIGYHFYTIRSLEPLYLAARAKKYDLSEMGKFLQMYTAPLSFSFGNGEFPSTNDGWPGTNIREMTAYYEIAAHLMPDSEIPGYLANMYQDRSRSTLDALLYGPTELPAPKPFPSESVLFEKSGIAILKNENINTYMKYGPYGGGHDHKDRLNMIFYANGHVLLPDLGTSGYGIPLNSKWFRAPASHNMLIVDGKYQAACSGDLVGFGPSHVHAQVTKAYTGVTIERYLSLHSNSLSDHIKAASQEEHIYDLFYHIRGRLIDCSVPLQSVPCLTSGQGYDMLSDLQKAEIKNSVRLVFDLRDTTSQLVMMCQNPAPFVLYTGTCPDNPADRKMDFFFLRNTSKSCQWTNNITISGGKPDDTSAVR